MILRQFTAMAVLGLSLATSAGAHDLQYTVGGGQASVISLFYVDNTPFSFESYEITREGEKIPFQVGRTDARGRIAFLPDGAATWQIKAISEDGHGLEFKFSTDAAALLVGADKPVVDRYSRIAVGVAVILGMFGFLSLYIKRKRAT